MGKLQAPTKIAERLSATPTATETYPIDEQITEADGDRTIFLVISADQRGLHWHAEPDTGNRSLHEQHRFVGLVPVVQR